MGDRKYASRVVELRSPLVRSIINVKKQSELYQIEQECIAACFPTLFHAAMWNSR